MNVVLIVVSIIILALLVRFLVDSHILRNMSDRDFANDEDNRSESPERKRDVIREVNVEHKRLLYKLISHLRKICGIRKTARLGKKSEEDDETKSIVRSSRDEETYIREVSYLTGEDDSEDEERDNPAEATGRSVFVFFATDRKRTGSNDCNSFYGGERNEEMKMEYGVCSVSIPNEHEIGQIKRPSWAFKLIYGSRENPEIHTSILYLENSDEDSFFEMISKKASVNNKKAAFIFIHGYNTSFAEAIRRTAQIKYDLGFECPAITYSWPSQATVQGYFADEDAVDWTVPHLKKFLKDVLQQPGIEDLHVIAHSMGNRALTAALRELKMEGYYTEKINQVVLAAPDIDAKVFVEQIAPAIVDMSERVTLYASSKDKALKTSRTIRTNINRVGESGPDIIIFKGIDTVDASQIDTDFLGHTYVAETKELIMDLHMIINLLLPPKDRKLKKVIHLNKGNYWQFPR